MSIAMLILWNIDSYSQLRYYKLDIFKLIPYLPPLLSLSTALANYYPKYYLFLFKTPVMNLTYNLYIPSSVSQLMVCLGEWLFPEFRFRWLSEETRKNLPIELDFYNEGLNCDRVKKMFKRFDFLKVCLLLFVHNVYIYLSMI